MDTMFRDYLVSKAEFLKNELSNAELPVEEILIKANEVIKLEKRVQRMDNPIPRKPRTKAETETA